VEIQVMYQYCFNYYRSVVKDGEVYHILHVYGKSRREAYLRLQGALAEEDDAKLAGRLRTIRKPVDRDAPDVELLEIVPLDDIYLGIVRVDTNIVEIYVNCDTKLTANRRIKRIIYKYPGDRHRMLEKLNKLCISKSEGTVTHA
jgi:hypothetical protein